MKILTVALMFSRPLFGGENDFQIVLKEAFPDLRTRRLTRRQWGMIRRMMGKPRRCSQVGGCGDHGARAGCSRTLAMVCELPAEFGEEKWL